MKAKTIVLLAASVVEVVVTVFDGEFSPSWKPMYRKIVVPVPLGSDWLVLPPAFADATTGDELGLSSTDPATPPVLLP